MNYLTELNPVQRQAVESCKGPSLIIAGAGSGKTRVLTYRIAHLLKQGINPGSVLALTFTNKAAKEMKERIAAMVDPSMAYQIVMGTFHSVFARILRREAELLGYTKNFVIYDIIDSKSIIKKIIKDLNLSDNDYKPNQVLNRISYAKNHLITPDAYFANPNIMEADKRAKRPRVIDIYKLYAQRCKKADAMDFDDLLLNINILFRDYPEILQKYQGFYKYILVDEFQDTNMAQYLIVKKLAQNHKNICVVGDDAQSIYAFRGAKIENILNFRNDFDGCQVFKLEQNYRSTQNIVNLANSLIANNDNQIQKSVFSEKIKGEKIKVFESYTDTDEAFNVTKSIIDLKEKHDFSYNKFAVLYRTNAQSRSFEEAFRKRNLPYKVYGGLSFYQRKEIKDMLAYYRLALNQKDDEAFRRIVNYPARGIGKTTLAKLDEMAEKTGSNLWEIATQPQKYNLQINSGTSEKIINFTSLIQDFNKDIHLKDAYELAEKIAKNSGVLKDLSDVSVPENITRQENLQELLNSIKEFTEVNQEEGFTITLDQYLESASLLINDNENDPENDDKITIMTIHSAKGLEFDNVYIVGVEEGLFPSQRSAYSQKDLEEERRLFYVAITRAKTNLFISHTNQRYRNGSLTFCRPSRFIYELDNNYLEMPLEKDNNDTGFFSTSNNQPPAKRTSNKKPADKSQEQAIQINKKLKKLSAAEKTNNTTQSIETYGYDDPWLIQTGMQVSHSRFGKGEVMQINGNDNNRKAIVAFHNHGEKQLLLKFAKLKILE